MLVVRILLAVVGVALAARIVWRVLSPENNLFAHGIPESSDSSETEAGGPSELRARLERVQVVIVALIVAGVVVLFGLGVVAAPFWLIFGDLGFICLCLLVFGGLEITKAFLDAREIVASTSTSSTDHAEPPSQDPPP